MFYKELNLCSLKYNILSTYKLVKVINYHHLLAEVKTGRLSFSLFALPHVACILHIYNIPAYVKGVTTPSPIPLNSPCSSKDNCKVGVALQS